MSHTIYFTTTMPPAQMLDEQLEAHIRLTIWRIQSVVQELASSWNHPLREQYTKVLREQMDELTHQLDAALLIHEARATAMR